MADNEQNQNLEEVEISSQDEEFLESVDHGVMNDDMNYRRLFFWSGFIIIMVAVFMYALIELYNYSSFVLEEKVSETTTFTQIEELKREGRRQLNSFGVVDAEQGIYHIPIDSAIKKMAQDTTQ